MIIPFLLQNNEHWLRTFRTYSTFLVDLSTQLKSRRFFRCRILLNIVQFRSINCVLPLIYFCWKFLAKTSTFANKWVKYLEIVGTQRCEIFGFFSSRSLKNEKKYISFAQFVYFWGKCVYSIFEWQNSRLHMSKNIQTEQN